MKDIYELMRQKEQLIEQLQKEVELLRTAANMLAEADGGPTVVRTAGGNSASAAAAAAPSVAAKRWP